MRGFLEESALSTKNFRVSLYPWKCTFLTSCENVLLGSLCKILTKKVDNRPENAQKSIYLFIYLTAKVYTHEFYSRPFSDMIVVARGDVISKPNVILTAPRCQYTIFRWSTSDSVRNYRVSVSRVQDIDISWSDWPFFFILKHDLSGWFSLTHIIVLLTICQ